jgi:hydroxymethylbilane synthase
MSGAAAIRLGTRGSALALAQSELVAARLRAAGHAVEIVVIRTRGDASDRPFRELEGKAFFTRELDEALLDRSIDVAVHSLKDLPTEEPAGLASVAVLPRADPRDVLLVRRSVARPPAAGATRPTLPPGTRIGTSSARRFAQLERAFPGVAVADLRGNVPTRVAKLRAGDHDAIVIAAAGVDRLALDLADLDRFPLDAPEFLPAPGQGVLAARHRADDADLAAALRPLIDAPTADGARAERLLLARLDGGCSLPLGAFARVDGDALRLDATLDRDGRRRTASARAATPEDAARLAHAVLAGRPVVLLTRPAELDAELVAALRSRDIACVEQPAIAFVERPASAAVDAAIVAAPGYDAVAFTSKRAVASWVHHARRLPVAPAFRTAAVGPATAAALERHGMQPWFHADGSGGAALAASLAKRLRRGARVLHPGPVAPEGTLAEELAARGIEVASLPLYETVATGDDPPLPDAPLVVACASPSAARAVLARPSLRERLARQPASIRFVAGGATTAAELSRLGSGPVAVSPLPVGEPLVATLAAACAAAEEGTA